MEKNWNPELNVGDTVICYHMEGETSVPPGTTGVVTRNVRDPFGNENDKIYEVKWNNGSNLSLVSVSDAWKKVPSKITKPNVTESKTGDQHYDSFSENQEIFKFFDWRFLRQYLKYIQKSGIINMVQAGNLLYSGPDHIEGYYGENVGDYEAFNDVLENAQKAKDLMINGTINYMESKNKEISLTGVNSEIRRMSSKMMKVYMTFYKS
jgi:hypothetical protein